MECVNKTVISQINVTLRKMGSIDNMTELIRISFTRFVSPFYYDWIKFYESWVAPPTKDNSDSPYNDLRWREMKVIPYPNVGTHYT